MHERAASGRAHRREAPAGEGGVRPCTAVRGGAVAADAWSRAPSRRRAHHCSRAGRSGHASALGHVWRRVSSLVYTCTIRRGCAESARAANQLVEVLQSKLEQRASANGEASLLKSFESAPDGEGDAAAGPEEYREGVERIDSSGDEDGFRLRFNGNFLQEQGEGGKNIPKKKGG